MMKKRILFPVVVALLTAIGLGDRAAAQSDKPTGVLNVAISSMGNEALDPRMSVPSTGKVYMGLMYDHFVGANRELNDISKETGIAKDWEVSSDGTVYTFHLRTGPKFWNGTPVTANDVKFSLERLQQKGTIASYAKAVLGKIKGGSTDKAIEVLDEHTVRITLKKSSATFLYDISQIQGNEGMVVSKAYVEKVGEEEFQRNPMGSGPYKFVEHKQGNYIKFVAREDPHWLVGVPRFQEVYIRNVPEEGTRVAMLRTGEADLVDASRDRVPKLKSSGFVLNPKPSFNYVIVMFMNLWEKDSPLNDVRVRKALSLAINRQELASALIPGFGKLASCHTADVVFTEARCRPLPYDPAQAKALLADYLTDHPNANLELRVPSFPRQGFPEQHLANQAIAEYWKAIGVKTKIERVDFGTFYSQDWLPKKCSRCAPVLAVVQQPFTQGILEAFTHSEGSLSYVGDMDPELDRLLENTRLATTIEEYANWYFQANDRIEHEKFYHTGLFDADAVWAYDPKKHERWPMGTSFGDIGLRNLVTRAAQ